MISRNSWYIFSTSRFGRIRQNMIRQVIEFDKIEKFYEYVVFTVMYKLISKKTPSYLYDNVTIGKSARTSFPRTNHRSLRDSYGVKLWNVLPTNVKHSQSPAAFKHLYMARWNLYDVSGNGNVVSFYSCSLFPTPHLLPLTSSFL